MKTMSTRRHFLHLVLLGSGAGVLVACSSSVPAPAPPANAPTAGAAAPTAAPTAAPKPTTSPAQAAPTTAAATKPTIAAAAATGNWDKIIDAAHDESALSLIVNLGDGPMQMVAAFQSKFPFIKVQSQGLLAVDLTPRMISEQRNGMFSYDMVAGSFINTVGSNWVPANAVQSIRPFLDDLPADVRDDTKWAGGFERFRTPDTTDAYVNQLVVAGGIWVNRDQIPATELTTAKQLLDPRYKSKIAIVDLTRVGGGTGAMTGLVHTEGEDFLRQLLSQQAPAIQDNQGLVNQWLVTGQYPIAIGAALQGIRDFQSKGVGTNVEQLREPQYSYLNPAGSVVIANAPHPNATRVFLSWFLGPEGQDQWAQNSTPDATTRRLDVKVYHPDTTPDWKRLSEYELFGGTPEYAAIQDRIIAIASGKA
jgi:iron(III) transport system substrate-binding protein